MAKWSSAQDLVGETLEGRFQLVRLLGEGGMGAVYEGRHLKLDARVAVKVLSRHLAQDERQRKRFLREARAAVRIRHDNVVQILDFGEEPVTYFVMEYLEGIDLGQLVEMSGRLPWARARGLLLPMMRALSAAHGVGIVHRDIKPSNVFVTRRETEDFVKVLDFGIAKVTDSGPETRGVTRTDEVVGTVAYMSPEQALAHPVDARTDIYSVGVLMFELLTGKTPYSGATQYQIIHQHVNAPIPSMRALEPSIPPAVDAIVTRAMQKRCDDRFPTMEAMLEAVLAVPADAMGDVVAPSPEVLQTGPRQTLPRLPGVELGQHGPVGEPGEPTVWAAAGATVTPASARRQVGVETSPDLVRSPDTISDRSGRKRSRVPWVLGGFATIGFVGALALGRVFGTDDAEETTEAAARHATVATPSRAEPAPPIERAQPDAEAPVELELPIQPPPPGVDAAAEALPTAPVDSPAPEPSAAEAAPAVAPEAKPQTATKARPGGPTTKAPAPRSRPAADAVLLKRIESGSRKCGLREPTRLKFQVMPNGTVLLVQSTPSNPCLDALARSLPFAPRDRPQSMKLDLKP